MSTLISLWCVFFFYKNAPVPMHTTPLALQMLIRQCGKNELPSLRFGKGSPYEQPLGCWKLHLLLAPSPWLTINVSTHLQHRLESNPSDDSRRETTMEPN